VPARLQVIRGYLRLLGPASATDVATFLDSALADIRAHWPPEAVRVDVVDREARALPDTGAAEVTTDLVRLLGPYDLLLQGRDRQVLVPDASRHRTLWPVLGRPGAVLVGTDVVGVWRPRTTGPLLTVRLDLWSPVSPAIRERLGQEAERLAAHRGVALAGFDEA